MDDLPTIWWYPDPVGAPEVISFPKQVTSYVRRDLFNQSTAETFGGAVHTQTFGGRERFELGWEGLDQEDGERVRRQLIPMVRHLRSGGMVHVALNTSRAWAAFVRSGAQRGATQVAPTQSILGGVAPAGSPLGSQVWVVGPQPLMRIELAKVTGYTAGTLIVFDDPLAEPWETERWTLLREEMTIPYARMPTADRNADVIDMTGARIVSISLPLEINPIPFEIASQVEYPTGSGDGFPGLDDIVQLDPRAGGVDLISTYGSGWHL